MLGGELIGLMSGFAAGASVGTAGAAPAGSPSPPGDPPPGDPPPPAGPPPPGSPSLPGSPPPPEGGCCDGYFFIAFPKAFLTCSSLVGATVVNSTVLVAVCDILDHGVSRTSAA